ncbi:hypothetical protein [Legionella donaldsonii]|uniref:hypothetical protein n=1 Tax=Legionella donaldsonii TaxID=45060 RepID=UPI0011C07FBB|nr:hypothetical protein [Legionella donaldsonii]
MSKQAATGCSTVRNPDKFPVAAKQRIKRRSLPKDDDTGTKRSVTLMLSSVSLGMHLAAIRGIGDNSTHY